MASKLNEIVFPCHSSILKLIWAEFKLTIIFIGFVGVRGR
jgi:hypothetical protein